MGRLFTRREILVLGGVTAAEVASSSSFLGALYLRRKWAETPTETPWPRFQAAVPEGTHIASVNSWDFLGNSKNQRTLTEMNGSIENLGKFDNTRLAWLPGKLDGEIQIDPLVLADVKQNVLISRAVGTWNPETKSGWHQEDLPATQDLITKAVANVSTFFGRSYFVTGFLPVFYLGSEEAEMLRSLENTDAVFNTTNALLRGDHLLKHSNLSENYAIAIASPCPEGPMTDEEKESLKISLGHELAHAYFNGVEIPPFDTHKVVNLAWYSEVLKRSGVDGLNNRFRKVIFQDQELEVRCWQIYSKATGKEFFRELMNRLVVRHGPTTLKFTQDQVFKTAKAMFNEAKVTSNNTF